MRYASIMMPLSIIPTPPKAPLGGAHDNGRRRFGHDAASARAAARKPGAAPSSTLLSTQYEMRK